MVEELFRKLREKGGCIMSSADCDRIEIIDAQVRGDWWVDENGFGYVLRLPGWLARHSRYARGANEGLRLAVEAVATDDPKDAWAELSIRAEIERRKAEG